MSADPFDPKVSASGRQRVWGAAVLLAIAVIALPFLLNGSGSESENKFRRVEKLREEPPKVVDRDGVSTTLPIQHGDQALVSFDSPVDAEDASGVPQPSSTDYAAANPGSEADLSSVTEDGTLTVSATTTLEGTGVRDRSAGFAGAAAGNSAAMSNNATIQVDSATTATGNRAVFADSTSDAQSGAIDTAESQITARLDQNAGETVAPPQALTAWVVLAGAFVSKADALGVRDRLRQAGFAAFVRDREASDELFRVLVGPMIKENAALDTLEEVAALLGSNASVLSYP